MYGLRGEEERERGRTEEEKREEGSRRELIGLSRPFIGSTEQSPEDVVFIERADLSRNQRARFLIYCIAIRSFLLGGCLITSSASRLVAGKRSSRVDNYRMQPRPWLHGAQRGHLTITVISRDHPITSAVERNRGQEGESIRHQWRYHQRRAVDDGD